MNQQKGVVKMIDRPKKPISIVIVYNNAEKLDEAKSWIEKQSVAADIQIIALDNRENRYVSAAMALNDGASRAEGDFQIQVRMGYPILRDILGGGYCDIHCNDNL